MHDYVIATTQEEVESNEVVVAMYVGQDQSANVLIHE